MAGIYRFHPKFAQQSGRALGRPYQGIMAWQRSEKGGDIFIGPGGQIWHVLVGMGERFIHPQKP